MARRGMNLVLTSLILLVLTVAGIALINGPLSEHIPAFGNTQTAHANSSTLDTCENNINNYCQFNPGKNWANTYPNCKKYATIINEGKTTCSGDPNDYSSNYDYDYNEDPNQNPSDGGTTTGDGSTTSDGSGGSSGGGGGGEDRPEEHTKTYDIHFVPSTDDYGTTQEYKDRVKRYMGGVNIRTPFRECQDIVNDIVWEEHKTEIEIAGEPDLIVEVSPADKCNAFQTKRGWADQITIYNGLPDDYRDNILAHELGHAFGLCDEYSEDEYNRQDTEIYPNGCANTFPHDNGWYHASTVHDGSGNQYSPICGLNTKESGQSGFAGYCGRDYDGDSTTKDASIMGGAGALDADMVRATDDPNIEYKLDNCRGMAIPQPGFDDEAYQAFLTRIQENYACGVSEPDSPEEQICEENPNIC